MKYLAVLLLVLTTSGCVPIIYSARYEAPSRQNLSDAVPAFIESGRTTMADVLLALGDPDTIAADESWIAYVSSYREGGGGAALVLVSSSSAGLLGGAFKEMLYRRLLVHFDATGIVTAATLDLVNCSNTDVFVGDASGSMAPCFDVTSTDIVARTLVANLQEAGETNVVVYRRAELLPTHQRGMVAVSDTAIHFVATGIYRTPRFPDIDIALADLTGAELGGHAFHLSAEGRRRVTLKREDAEIATFVVLAENGDDASRTTEAGELVSQRIAAVRRTDQFSRSPVVTPDGTQ